MGTRRRYVVVLGRDGAAGTPWHVLRVGEGLPAEAEFPEMTVETEVEAGNRDEAVMLAQAEARRTGKAERERMRKADEWLAEGREA